MAFDINSIITLVIVGLIGLIVGVMAGVALGGLFPTRRDSGTRQSRRLTELVRIWRDRRSGGLALEIGGKMFTSPKNLTVNWQSGVMRLINELQLWMGMADLEQPSPPQPTPGSVSRRATTTNASTPSGPISSRLQRKPSQPADPTSVPSAAQMGEFQGQGEIFSDPEQEVEPVKVTMGSIISRMMGPRKSKEEEPSMSIAAQINEILQERLPSTPLRDHVIRLSDVPGEGGLVVMVDMKRYGGVDEVPIPEVRELIKQCVEEWEMRSTGV